MAIIPTNAERAQSSVAKAEAAVSEWTTKASAARAEAAELDATAGAAILADESAAERITLKVQALERKARAYDQAANEAVKQLTAAQRDVLEAEAKELDKAAAQARKALTSHEANVSGLLAQLKEVDGCDYAPGRDLSPAGAERGQAQTPRSISLRNEVIRLEARAASIRFYLQVGKVPLDYVELNQELGTQFNSLRSFNGDAPIVESLRAAASAGWAR